MSYYNPATYNRNNLLKYARDEEINAVYGADYIVDTVLHITDEISENACKEVLEAAEQIRTYTICAADDLVVSILDNLPEEIELDDIEEGEIVYSLVDNGFGIK